MNAPYDGERRQRPGSDPAGEPAMPPSAPGPHPAEEQPHAPYGEEQAPYEQGQYAQESYEQGQYQQGQYEQAQYEQSGYAPSGYAQDQYAQDQYAQPPYPQDPRQQDPHQQDPYPQDPRQQDPRLRDPRQQDPRQQPPRPQDPRQQPPHGRPPYEQSQGAYGRPPAPYAQDPRQYEQHTAPYPQASQPPGQPPAQDPYLQSAYGPVPYPEADPLADSFYDQAAHPPPPPGSQPPAQPLYQPPPPPQHGPDAQMWAQPPAPEPDGPGRYLPYGDANAQTQYLGVDDLVSRAAGQPEPDAFAHLYRDQGSVAHAPDPQQEQAAVPPQRTGSRVSSLAKSSAVMAAGTLVSRVTGFLRQLLLVAALGGGVLNDTYTVAWTLPTMIYILTIGGGLNSVFVPQLVRSMKNDEDGGEAFANRLLTVVTVALGALVLVSVFAAPLLVHMLSGSIAGNPDANNVAVTFARYCLPTIFFMGIHVVMGQILNARGRFGAMMWTPVLNNVVIIFTLALFLWVYGTSRSSGLAVGSIPPEGVRLLGMGTLLGLIVQALAMIPYLRETGFKIRPRFDWRGHGLGKSAKLAKWTVLFVLANQLGNIVVTQLATSAGKTAGGEGHGITAYQSALLIWQMPQAIITVSVMAALLPRISRAAADGDPAAVRDDISHGLRTSAVAIVPVAFGLLSLGVPMCLLMFGSSGIETARAFGYVLMAFGVGLIPFSVQYVVLRGFYAYEDTRTPFYNTLIVAMVSASVSVLCYLTLPARFAVVGMAAAYGLAYVVGVGVAWRRLKVRVGGDLDGLRVVRTYARLCIASVPAALLSGLIALGLLRTLGDGFFGSLVALVFGGAALLGVFYVTARRLRIEELNAMVGMVRARLGR